MTNVNIKKRKKAIVEMRKFADAARKAVNGKPCADFICPLCGGSSWAYRDYKDRVRAACGSCGVKFVG